MSLVTTEVLQIEAEIAGPEAGRPVLLLHGWPDAPRGWNAVAALLHAAGWRTITPFLRGSGAPRFRSPGTPRDAQAPALAQDAVDLTGALGLESVPVAGHDWGARAAYTLAALFPRRATRSPLWRCRTSRGANSPSRRSARPGRSGTSGSCASTRARRP